MSIEKTLIKPLHIFFLRYNQYGLLRTAKWPTGHVTKLKTNVNVTHAAVTLSRTGLVDVVTTKTHTAWALTQINKQGTQAFVKNSALSDKFCQMLEE